MLDERDDIMTRRLPGGSVPGERWRGGDEHMDGIEERWRAARAETAEHAISGS